jgi:molecular chaperone HscB
MNYFEFYELAPAFLLDESDLKKRFLKYSKMFHPDFHTLESDEAQNQILEKATFNTEAYKVLQNFDSRMAYILELKGMKKEEGQEKLPQDFLVEMMDINETLMDLQFDFDAENFEKAKKQIEEIENDNFFSIKDILQNFDFQTVTNNDLENVKIFSLKKKYFLRIQKTLTTFAPQ